MGHKLMDIEGARELTVDATSQSGSVFLVGPRGFCMEFDRAVFVEAMRVEFDLIPVALARLKIVA